MNRDILQYLSAFALALAIWGCGNTPMQTADGGGSEVEITGKLANEDGTPAGGVQVYLRPNDYLPYVTAKAAARSSSVNLQYTLTDSMGNFSFDSVTPDTYLVECLEIEGKTGALIDSIKVDGGSSVLYLPADTLKELGTIAGKIQLPESLSAARLRVLVYGLDRIFLPDTNGDYVLTGLAEGTYTLRFQILMGQGIDEDRISVAAGDTTNIAMVILSEVDRIYAPKASGIIAIDGVPNEPGWSIAQGIAFSRLGYTENVVTVKTLWDSVNLYVSYIVEDTLLGVDTTVAKFYDDAVELFVDPENRADTILNSDDVQILANIQNEFEVYRGLDSLTTGPITVKADTTPTGYAIEMAVPWAWLGIVPAEGKAMGVLFANDDWENGVTAQLDWLGLKDLDDGSYKRPNLWGDLILE